MQRFSLMILVFGKNSFENSNLSNGQRAHFYTPFGVVRICGFAPHQSLPCVRGGGPLNGGSEGLSIPQSASLTAPFTQGSLGRRKRQLNKLEFDRVSIQ